MIVFDPNCSLPATSPAFVSSPDVRGTLSILWNCLAIIVLCTWSALHLDVPIQTKPRKVSQHIWKAVYLTTRKVGGMLLTLMAPEIMVGKAMTDRMTMALEYKKYKSVADKDCVPWTLSHTFFAAMGGFVICFAEDSPLSAVYVEEPSASQPQVSLVPSLTLPHAQETGVDQRHGDQCVTRPQISHTAHEPTFDTLSAVGSHKSTFDEEEAVSGDDPNRRGSTTKTTPKKPVVRKALVVSYENLQQKFRNKMERYRRCLGDMRWRPHSVHASLAQDIFSEVDQDPPKFLPKGMSTLNLAHALLALEGTVWVLDARQLEEARRLGIISRLPFLAEEDIADKDKGDAIVRILAISQTVMLMANLICRQSQGLSSSPLEVMALAFSVCAFMIYVFNWDKPRDVASSWHIPATRSPTKEEMRALAFLRPQPWFSSVYYSKFFLVPSYWAVNFSSHRMPGLQAHFGLFHTVTWSCIGSAAFGGIHLLAWNFPFPSDTEQYLWRVSSILTAVGPFLPAALVFIACLPFIQGRKFRFVSRIEQVAITGFRTLFGIWLLFFSAARFFLAVEAFRTLFYLPPNVFQDTWISDVPHLG